MQKYFKLFLILSLAVFSSQNLTAQIKSNISPVAKEYLEQALKIMEQNSLRKKQVNWQSLRRKTFAKAQTAQETIDTWEAIRFALNEIGDNHSFLQLSDELEKKETLRWERKAKNIKNKVNAKPISPFVFRRTPEGVYHFTGNCLVPIIVVPFRSFTKTEVMNAYAEVLNKFIVEADNKNPCGWIVDLRGNGGGAVYPMLAGIGVLFGDGNATYAIDAEGKRSAFFYRQGQSGLIETNGIETIITKIDTEIQQVKKKLPTAILIDRGTGSSGDTIAIAFCGLPNTRFFGESSAGVSTSTEGFKLSDGANIVLVTAINADRNGKLYPSGIKPDKKVQMENKIPPINQDKTVKAALKWISERSQ